MPRTRLLVGAVALALAASAAHAQRFTSVVSFGDSLSDAGNIGLAPAAAGGLGGALGPSQSFTTNPDPVMVELLAAAFGQAQRASLAGGTNFAWGGACARPAAAAPCTNNPNPATRLDAQIGQHLGAGTANPNALYTVWMGANDLFGAIPVWASNPATAQANATVGGVPVATAVVQQVARLQAAGARNIVVLNLPNLGTTPQFSSGPLAAAGPLASLATVSYNSALSQGLSTLGTGIIPINVFGLVDEVRANPGAFGLTNVTGVACTTASSITCTRSTLVNPTAADTFLFADGVHPTGAAHRLLANVTLATINAPSIVSLAPETAIAAYDSHGATINANLFSEYLGEREDGTVRGYLSVGGGSGEFASDAFSPGGDTTAFNATAGANYRLNETFTFGLAASLGNQNFDPAGGTIDGNSVLLSGYGVLNFGAFNISGIISGGSTNADIARSIALGASTRVENGETDVDHTAGEINVGYVFGSDTLAHGPFAGYVWQEATVAAYQEDGVNSTSMNFREFSRESRVIRAGWQLKADFGAIKPYARVAWNSEEESGRTVVNAGSNSMGGRFQQAGFAPSEDWTSADLGLGFQFSETFGGHITYSGRFGDDVVDRDQLSIGLSMGF
jgi:outer membrane lipase/esterase